jgi:hypothetical protein
MLRKFSGHDLTGTLSRIESAARGVSAANCSNFLLASGAEKDVLAAASLQAEVFGLTLD